MEEKKKIIEKINNTISKKRVEMLNQLPEIYKINDGMIIRFFSCTLKDIKFKTIKSNNIHKKLTYFYLPKDTIFTVDNNICSSLTCIKGKLEIEFDSNIFIINHNNKKDITNNKFQCKALQNTYVLTDRTI